MPTLHPGNQEERLEEKRQKDLNSHGLHTHSLNLLGNGLGGILRARVVDNNVGAPAQTPKPSFRISRAHTHQCCFNPQDRFTRVLHNAYRCAAPERQRRQNRTTPARCPRRSRPQHAAFAAALQRRTQIVARVSTVSQTPRRGSDAPAWASAHCSPPPSPPIVAGGCVLSSMVVQTLLLEGFPRKNI